MKQRQLVSPYVKTVAIPGIVSHYTIIATHAATMLTAGIMHQTGKGKETLISMFGSLSSIQLHHPGSVALYW